MFIQTSPPPGIQGSIILSPGYPIPPESFIVGNGNVSLQYNDDSPLQVQSVEMMTAEIILYEQGNFMGNNLPLTGSVYNLSKITSAVIVASGRWRLYDNTFYGGSNAQFVTGNYPNDEIVQMVGDNAVSSVRLEAYD